MLQKDTMEVTRLCLTSLAVVVAATVSSVNAAEDWQDAGAIPQVSPVERMETVRTVDDFQSGIDGWISGESLNGQACKLELSHDPAGGRQGDGALKLQYAFSGREELEYLDFRKGLDIPEPGMGLVIWLRQEAGKKTLGFRIRIEDRSGEIHQPEIAYTREGDWLGGAVRFASGPCWGGDGNHHLDYPCRLHSLVFDRPGPGCDESGALWIDQIDLAKPSEAGASVAMELANPQPGNVYEPGQQLRIRPAAGQGALAWHFEDHRGKQLASGRWNDGDTTAVELPLEQPGWFQPVAERRNDDGSISRSAVPIAVLPQPARRNDQVGLSVHFGQWWPLETMDLIRRYGVTLYRDEIAWMSVEQQSGVYVMPEHARAFLERGRQLDMEPLIILDYGNPLYDGGNFPNSPAAISAFAHFAAWMGSATRDTVKHFEVWNEWCGGCGMTGRGGEHTPESYARLLMGVFPALRETRPDATIVGVGGEFIRPIDEMVARVGRAGASGSMDTFSIHPYTFPQLPEQADLKGIVSDVLEAAGSEGMPQRAWVTEIGYHTALIGTGSTLNEQAQAVVRSLAILQGTGVERIFWYDFMDDGMDDGNDQHRFGLAYHLYHRTAPKPAAVAFGVYHQRTAGCIPQGVSCRDDGVWVATYRRENGSRLLVAWSADGPGTLDLDVAPLALTDLMGVSVPVTAGSVQVGPEPVYVDLPPQ